MSETMKYSELKEQGSKGPFTNEMNSAYQDIRSGDGSMRCSVYGWDDDEDCTAEKRDANALRIAHVLNHFDQVLEALKDFEGVPDCYGCYGMAEQALKDAQEVKV